MISAIKTTWLTNLSLYLWLDSPSLDLGRFFSFLILFTVGMTPWAGDQSVGSPPHAHRTTQTHNKRSKAFMPQVGFEPTVPEFELVKAVPALDCAATLIGYS
jgi:hypothetical protein